MGNSNQLFESIFKRKLSAPDTHSYLAELLKEHPYFTPAQFFLLLSTIKGSVEYEQQAAKTSALFNNAHWLQFQLTELAESTDEISFTEEQEDEFLLQQELALEETIASIQLPEPGESIQPGVSTIATEPDIGVMVESPSTVNDENIPEWFIGEAAVKGNEAAPLIDEPTLSTTSQSEREQVLHQPAEEKEPEQTIDETGPTTVVTGEPKNETITAENIEEPIGTIEPPPHHEKKEEFITGHFNNDTTPLVNDDETGEDDTTGEEIQPLNFKLNIDTSKVTEETIAFEPLHTTDYFASLGIRLSGDVKPTDKLGKQLKSFTEWLKTMKKIHKEQLPQQSEQADVNIQKLAEQSNKEDAVLTEAMADVLLQQGKVDKAIEVFKKLSLFNPSKSAYFAAKIDQLKEH